VLPGAHHLAEAKAALSRNDSYGWFSSDPLRAQHLLRTGPTGTNVADLVVVLAEAPEAAESES
jgi:glycerate-2-kinase